VLCQAVLCLFYTSGVLGSSSIHVGTLLFPGALVSREMLSRFVLLCLSLPAYVPRLVVCACLLLWFVSGLSLVLLFLMFNRIFYVLSTFHNRVF